MQLVQEVRGILGGMRDARAGCPSQNDDADEQRDASVGAKYSGHACHTVYHTYQDDWPEVRQWYIQQPFGNAATAKTTSEAFDELPSAPGPPDSGKGTVSGPGRRRVCRKTTSSEQHARESPAPAVGLAKMIHTSDSRVRLPEIFLGSDTEGVGMPEFGI
jgi:hypothetical protein